MADRAEADPLDARTLGTSGTTPGEPASARHQPSLLADPVRARDNARVWSRIQRQRAAAAAVPGSTDPLVADNAAVPPAGRAASEGSFFGRSLLYVVVGSLQLLATSLISPVIAYLLSPADFGLVSLTLSIYQLLFILAVFGFDQVLVVYATDAGSGPEKARRLLGMTVVYSFVLTAALAGTLPYWRGVAGQHHFSGVLLAGVIWVGPSAANAFILALLRSQDRFAWFALISLLSALGGQIVGVCLLLTVSHDPVLYTSSGVATQLIALVVGLAVTRPRMRSPLGPKAIRDVLRISAPIAASAVAVYVLNTSDRIVIARDLGEVSVARYQVAYVVGSVVILMLGFLNGAWLPMLLRLKHTDAMLRTVANRSRDYLLLILVPITLGIVIAAPTLLRLVAPSSFGGATLVDVTVVVALSAFPVAYSQACARILIAVGRRAPIAWCAGVAGAVNLVLNIAIVPSRGIFGSALATLIAYTLQAVLMSTQTHGRRWPLPMRLLTIVVITSIVAVASIQLPVSRPWLATRLGAGVVLGLIGLAFLPRARNAMNAAAGQLVTTNNPITRPPPLPRHAAGRRPMPFRRKEPPS